MKMFVDYCTSKARQIVLSVLRPHAPLGLTTHEIFEACVTQFPEAKQEAPPPRIMIPRKRLKGGIPVPPVPDAPYREHPIRSVRYLKKVVLEHLVATDEVEKIHIRRSSAPQENLEREEARSRKNAVSKVGKWRWRLRTEHGLMNEDTPVVVQDERVEVKVSKQLSKRRVPK